MLLNKYILCYNVPTYALPMDYRYINPFSQHLCRLSCCNQQPCPKMALDHLSKFPGIRPRWLVSDATISVAIDNTMKGKWDDCSQSWVNKKLSTLFGAQRQRRCSLVVMRKTTAAVCAQGQYFSQCANILRKTKTFSLSRITVMLATSIPTYFIVTFYCSGTFGFRSMRFAV